MAGDKSPSDNELEELSSNLNEGLKTCRSMVANYREMISGEHAPAANDEGGEAGEGAEA